MYESKRIDNIKQENKMKFKLTSETKVFLGKTLYRIEALIDFGIVEKGELGGYIEKETNLSQNGNAWVSGNAWVCTDIFDEIDALLSEATDPVTKATLQRIADHMRAIDDAQYLERRIEQLEAALKFYANDTLNRNPNDGPWGQSSEDFGHVARAALEQGEDENGD